MTPIRILVTLDGRPAGCSAIHIDGLGEAIATDEAGRGEAALPSGRITGRVSIGARDFAFVAVNAPGTRAVRIELHEPETPINDPQVRASMPTERYVPLKLLGRGAAGSVYRCRDTTLDRLVAIKLLNDDFATSDRERDEFLIEGRNLAKIEHPNLIPIYDLGVHRGRVYMVVQYIDGPDLESLLTAEGRLSVGAAAAAGVQLMRALDALHERGLVHRDVKPSNALVARDGRVRLADFGLVRSTIDFTDPRSKVFGTPAYMSPEQLQARPLGPATDVYALGASIFHLASGRLPFGGANPILAHIVEEPPDLRELVPDAPAALAGLLRAMMAKTPEARPHADQVVAALLPYATTVSHTEGNAFVPRLHLSDVGSGAPDAVPIALPTREARQGVPTSSTPSAGATSTLDPAASEVSTPPFARRLAVLVAIGALVTLAAGVGLRLAVRGSDADPAAIELTGPPASPEPPTSAASSPPPAPAALPVPALAGDEGSAPTEGSSPPATPPPDVGPARTPPPSPRPDAGSAPAPSPRPTPSPDAVPAPGRTPTPEPAPRPAPTPEPAPSPAPDAGGEESDAATTGGRRRSGGYFNERRADAGR